MNIFQRDAHSSLVSFGDAARHLAADSSNLALQLTKTCFLRVLKNDSGERSLRDVQVARRDAVLLNLFGQQMPTRNLALLFFGVARQTNHLHAVAQGGL